MINPEDTSCPKCRAYKPAGATFCVECGYGKDAPEKVFCTQCGAELEKAGMPCPMCARAEAETSVRCANCGAEVKADLDFCTNCGARMASTAKTAASEPETASACQNCGATNRTDHNFCIYCGAKLSQGLHVPLFCPRCGCRRGKEKDACPACGEIF